MESEDMQHSTRVRRTACETAPGVGIVGGVGPMAGIELHRRIVELTVTDGSDQDHLDVVHVSQASAIADRTAFLLGQTSVNPAEAAAPIGLRIVRFFETVGKPCLIAVPCNTFHVPPIFDVFLERLGDAATAVVNLLEATVNDLDMQVGRGARIGLLTTTGTRANGVWETLLKRQGYDVAQIDPVEQPRLQAAIYDPGYGLKANSRVSDIAAGIVGQQVETLCSRGADVVLLGCTELPLVFPGQTRIGGKPLIDPLTALARALIVRAGGTVAD